MWLEYWCLFLTWLWNTSLTCKWELSHWHTPPSPQWRISLPSIYTHTNGQLLTSRQTILPNSGEQWCSKSCVNMHKEWHGTLWFEFQKARHDPLVISSMAGYLFRPPPHAARYITLAIHRQYNPMNHFWGIHNTDMIEGLYWHPKSKLNFSGILKPTAAALGK